MRWLVIAAISTRLLAAGLLAFGPWTNTASELDGWDVERFQEIADANGQAWVDHEVEYPPGSVIIIEAIAGSGVVATHRLLVLVSLVVDGAIALGVTALGGRRAGAWYLILGLPLVPMGLLRLDLWAVALAVLAVAALQQRRPRAFAVLTTLGALVKIWPALLLAPALALGRGRAVLLTAGAMVLSGLVWIGWAGWSLEPIVQVASLRGATGWHLESVPGSLTALFGNDEPELQFNAYRIGSLTTSLVRVGQGLTIITVMALVAAGWRAHRYRAPHDVGPSRDRSDLTTTALIMAGAVSALIVTAPLLSPQFLLWLTPWAALAASGSGADSRLAGFVVWPVGAATLITGLTLAAFGPPDLAGAVPAILLLVRDGCLLATVLGAAIALHRRHGQREPVGISAGTD